MESLQVFNWLPQREAATTHGGSGSSRPCLMDYLQRIDAQPAYQSAVDRDSKYELMRC